MKSPWKYQKINEVLQEWYQRCCVSNIYLNGPMLTEEPLEIKEKFPNRRLDEFNASDGWLDGWKSVYFIKEH